MKFFRKCAIIRLL